VLLPADGGVHELGTACAIRAGTAFVGAWGDDDVSPNAGSAYLFLVPGGAEIDEIHPPYPSGTSPGFFGDSVAISDDYLLVGAPSYQGAGGVSSGAAFLYSRSGVLLHEFRANAPEDGGRYADAVGLAGPYTVVGGARQDAFGRPLEAGLVDVYESVSGNRLRTLLPENAAIKGFGAGFAIDGTLAAIGTDLVFADMGQLTSSAFLFDIETGVQLAELCRPRQSTFGGFGAAVALEDHMLLVAHQSDNSVGVNAGAVYVYDVAVPVKPILRARLTASDAGPFWQFGSSVAIDGQIAVVGSQGRLGGRGGAYVFDLMTMRQMCVLSAPDSANPEQNVGSSVAIEGATIVVGARSYRNGADVGAAFVFAAPSGLACARADLAEPFGLLDLADVTEFVMAFLNEDPAADFEFDGVFDLADLVAFATAFLAGCL
jgi:hypothetical protein